MGDKLDTVFVSPYFWGTPPDTSALEWVFNNFDKNKTKITLTYVFPLYADSTNTINYRNLFNNAVQSVYLERCRNEQFKADVLVPTASQNASAIPELINNHGMKKFVMHTAYFIYVTSGFINTNISCKIWFLSNAGSPNKIESIWHFQSGPEVQDVDVKVEKLTKKNGQLIEEIEHLKENAALSTHMTFEELVEATNNFDDELIIGEGAAGSVYRGTFRGTKVIVKRLRSRNEQTLSKFRKEVGFLSTMRHPNLITLIGTSSKPLTLVYEFLPNGSLHNYMIQGRTPLPWKVRTRIISEICLALNFLHSNKPEPTIYGDLKPLNVYLDANFTSKLSDFGLVKKACTDYSNAYQVEDPERTFAYLDPEFKTTYKLTLKSDVYSFGVIILRLLTGKSPLGIRGTVEKTMGTNEFGKMIDESAGKWPVEHAAKLADIGIRCAHEIGHERPDLVTVVWPIIEELLKFPDEAI